MLLDMMFENSIIWYFNTNMDTIESVLKWLRNMQHYYVQESFTKGKLHVLFYLKLSYN